MAATPSPETSSAIEFWPGALKGWAFGMRTLLIGIDSGTESTKALFVCASIGKILGSGAQTYWLITSLPTGAKEQHPRTWRDAPSVAVHQMFRAAKLGCETSIPAQYLENIDGAVLGMNYGLCRLATVDSTALEAQFSKIERLSRTKSGVKFPVVLVTEAGSEFKFRKGKERQRMRIIILAAGYATRLYPLTLTQAKPFLPVNSLLVTEHVFDSLAPIGGTERLYVVTNAKFAGHSTKCSENRRKTKPKSNRIIKDVSTDAANMFSAIGDIRSVTSEALGIRYDIGSKHTPDSYAIKLSNQSKERALVGEVISTVALADQISREFNVSDQGIDMEIEFTDGAHRAAGRKLYLQLKSGDSYLRKRKSDGAEIFTIKDERHARYWMVQKFPVLLVIRNAEGRVRWMDVRDWLKRESDNGRKPVKQIVFTGEQFDVMSVRRWREKLLNSAV